MGFSSNDSSKETVKVVKFYTGVAPFYVVAINPTKEELSKLYNTTIEKDIEYTTFDENAQIKTTRVDIYLQNGDIIIKHAIFLKNRFNDNKTGDKFQFTNKYGMFSWGESKEVVVNRVGKNGKPFFKDENVVEAYVGQQELVDTFLRKWLNVASRDVCQVENIKKITEGDVSELKKYVKDFKKNIVKALVYVEVKDDGKMYQRVYSRYFERGFVNTFTGFEKALKENYGTCKGTFQDSFEFKEYNPTTFGNQTDKEPEENSEGINPFA